MSCLYARVLQVTFNHVLKISELRFFQPEPFDLPCCVYVDYVYVARHSLMMLSPCLQHCYKKTLNNQTLDTASALLV
jgi:hypothetical protein